MAPPGLLPSVGQHSAGEVDVSEDKDRGVHRSVQWELKGGIQSAELGKRSNGRAYLRLVAHQILYITRHIKFLDTYLKH